MVLGVLDDCFVGLVLVFVGGLRCLILIAILFVTWHCVFTFGVLCFGSCEIALFHCILCCFEFSGFGFVWFAGGL